MEIFELLYEKLKHLVLIVEDGLISNSADELFGKIVASEKARHPLHYHISIFLAKIMRNMLAGNIGGDYLLSFPFFPIFVFIFYQSQIFFYSQTLSVRARPDSCVRFWRFENLI